MGMVAVLRDEQNHERVASMFRKSHINRIALGRGSIERPREMGGLPVADLFSGLVESLPVEKVGAQFFHPFRFGHWAALNVNLRYLSWVVNELPGGP